MLSGEHGYGVAKSMELLVALGEVFGAERLVHVDSAHVSGVSYKNLGDAGLEWLEDQAKLGAKARVKATLNPAGMDMARWREMNIPEEFADKQRRVIKAFENLGIETNMYLYTLPRGTCSQVWKSNSMGRVVRNLLLELGFGG